MDALFPILMVGGIIALVAAILIWSYYAEKKRREALTLIAEQMGLSFVPKGPDASTLGFGICPIFNRGHSRRVYNLMTGKLADVDLYLCDYRYTTGSGKNSSTHSQTLVVFGLTQNKLPKFTLAPEHFFHRIASALGFNDIDFDTHPEFSKKYLLKGDDEATIRAIFTPTVLEFFEENIAMNWTVEAFGDWLVIYRASRRAKPEEWPDFLEKAFNVMNVLSPAGA